jgi:DNA-binding MarR family transcriptional regulator
MQKKRLILRQREGMDQRVVTVRRTAAGRSATQRLLPTAIAYENAALQGFSAREAATLKAMLKRLYANMDALDRETPQSPAKTRSA